MPPSLAVVYRNVDGGIYRLEAVVVTIGLVLSVAATVVEVILRTSSNLLETVLGVRQSSSLGGGGEFAQMTMIWAVLVGAAMGTRAGVHIGVDVLVQRLPAPLTKTVVLAAIAVGTVFTAWITVLGFQLVQFSLETGQVTMELLFPRWLLYLSVPVSMALMTFHQAQLFAQFLQQPAAQVKRAAQAEVAAMAEAEQEAASR